MGSYEFNTLQYREGVNGKSSPQPLGGKSRCFLQFARTALTRITLGCLNKRSYFLAVVEASIQDEDAHTLFLLGDLFPAPPLLVLVDGCVTLHLQYYHFPWVCVHVQTFSFTRIPVTLDQGLS